MEKFAQQIMFTGLIGPRNNTIRVFLSIVIGIEYECKVAVASSIRAGRKLTDVKSWLGLKFCNGQNN